MDEMEEVKEYEVMQNLYRLAGLMQRNRNLRKENTMLRLKAARYKALFQGENKLADKLDKQIKENEDAIVGEFDGFAYSSKRARARFKTLEEMFENGVITKKEYDFAKEVDL
ncbi:MAG: hypothetical protein J6J36_03030 [Clostridia bacterium]|nr:hypothetical protein [Clostridia bacterium]